MLGKKSLPKIDQIRNRSVSSICPPTSKFKTITRAFTLFHRSFTGFLDVLRADGVAVILSMCAVGNNKQLHIFKKSRRSPKTFSAITIDLIERLGNSHATALELDMHQRQPVHQHRHVIAIGTLAVLPAYAEASAGRGGVLIDHLQTIVVNVVLFYEVYILGCTIFARQVFDMVFLNGGSLFGNTLVWIGKLTGKKPLPFAIGKSKII